MILVKSLFLDPLVFVITHHGAIYSDRPAFWISRLHLIDFARHELDLCTLESFSALVIHRDPTDDVEDISLGRSNHVVIGLPVHAAGYVAELSGRLSGFVGAQC